MDNLQDAYKDEDDELPPQTTTNTTLTDDSNLDPNPIPTQPPPETPIAAPMPVVSTVDPATDPKPDPIAAEPTAEPEEPKPEPEPMAESEPEHEPDATAAAEESKPEPMAVDSAEQAAGKAEAVGSEDVSSDSISEDEPMNNAEVPESSEKKEEEEEDDGEGEDRPQKKLKTVEEDHEAAKTPGAVAAAVVAANGNGNGKKASKKKSKNSNNVWTKTTSRKGKKKARHLNGGGGGGGSSAHAAPKADDTVKITPLPRFPDKNDDSPEAKICLSKVYKAEKVELSEDRMSAGSCKGYRMVRATRGVSDGAWFFEIKVVSLGETGHTRLGWSTEKGDLQAPVGYDGCSFGYRDVDGSKVHKALREKYGEDGYKEGDVIGCYISLPEGDSFAPKPPHLVWFKGQKYVANDSKEDPPKIVPGSEISFFKNGICQEVAFKDICGGLYYPAASMYTLPNQPNCVVKFNFGPEFECFPADFEGRPIPRPMIEVPYHGYDNRVENGVIHESKQ